MSETDTSDLPVVIVGLPRADDPIHGTGDEEKHVTLAYLGPQTQHLDAIKAALDGIVRHIPQFSGLVIGITQLGDDDPPATVALLDKNDPTGAPAIREQVLAAGPIGELHDSIEQKYPDYTPHVTLAYGPVDGTDSLPGNAILFDRLALWAGDDHTEYPLGVEMTDTMNVPEVDDTLDPTEADLAAGMTTGMPVPWHGVLAPEGVMSGDRRKFATGSMRFRDLPLPLAHQSVNAAGHDGSVIVGRIDGIERADGVMRAWGVFDTSANADEAVRQMSMQMLRGVSVDVDDATFEYEFEDGKAINGDDMMEVMFGDDADPVMVVSDGRICGATLCAIPAFQEAFLELGPAPLDWGTGEVVTAAGDTTSFAEKVSDTPWSEFKEANYTPDQWYAACTLHRNGDSRLKGDNGLPIREPSGTLNRNGVHAAASRFGSTDGPRDAMNAAKAQIRSAYKTIGETPPDIIASSEGIEEFVNTHDGPGWITNPEDTQRLRSYWTRGAGRAKIAWGVPGDFDRCRAHLGKYVMGPFLAGTCANLHYEALGYWPGQGPHAKDKKAASLDGGHAITPPCVDCIDSMVASAAPASAFANPNFDGPTPLTIDEDGRVFGHVATWGTCHIGYDGQCITPPHSEAGYAYFTTGSVMTDDGVTPVGNITMGTGHASPKFAARPAMDHYDNTGTAVADVAAGEDDYGIWIAGQMRPGVPEAQRHALAAGALSGDWRRIGGNLELVAALAVNVPGFPIPRVASSEKDGRQLALVASGIVVEDTSGPFLGVEAAPGMAKALYQEMAAINRRAKRATALAQKIGRDRQARALAASAAVHGGEN